MLPSKTCDYAGYAPPPHYAKIYASLRRSVPNTQYFVFIDLEFAYVCFKLSLSHPPLLPLPPSSSLLSPPSLSLSCLYAVHNTGARWVAPVHP
jgi:hypothetical protein